MSRLPWLASLQLCEASEEKLMQPARPVMLSMLSLSLAEMCEMWPIVSLYQLSSLWLKCQKLLSSAQCNPLSSAVTWHLGYVFGFILWLMKRLNAVTVLATSQWPHGSQPLPLSCILAIGCRLALLY